MGPYLRSETMNVPIYVKVEKYRDLVSVLKKIETKLETVDKTIEKINSLKEKEEKQLKEWNDNIADVKDRVSGITDAFQQG